MSFIRLSSAVVLCILAGCALVLPRPSRPPPRPPAAEVAYDACTLELTELRKSRSTSIHGAGAAQPLIIELAAGPSADHAIRDGTSVVLRLAAGAGGRPDHEKNVVVASVEAVGAGRGLHDGVQDQDVIRLHVQRASGGPDRTTEAESVSRAMMEGGFVLFKADTPNPNRPSSCDARLRDGDFIFLQTPSRSGWVVVKGGMLVEGRRGTQPESECRESRESCYTDRYGGVLCANYFECPADSGP